MSSDSTPFAPSGVEPPFLMVSSHRVRNMRTLFSSARRDMGAHYSAAGSTSSRLAAAARKTRKQARPEVSSLRAGGPNAGGPPIVGGLRCRMSLPPPPVASLDLERRL